MLFVDTGAWFALAVAADPDHEAARSVIEVNRQPLVTTDYVIDELLTLFRVRHQRQRAILWIEDVLLGGGVNRTSVNSVDFDRALTIYRTYSDKFWSFTDCTSLAVMERLQISTAFSFDEHFRQFGSITVLPGLA